MASQKTGQNVERAAARQKTEIQQADEALATKTATFSHDSERVLCATMLRTADDLGDGTVHAKLSQLLAPEDFFEDMHQAIWSIASTMQTAGLPIDAVAISDAAARQELNVGGAPYLGGLLDDPLSRPASVESILQAAKRVKELSMLRRLQASLRQALSHTEAGYSFDEVASVIEDDLVNLRGASSSNRTGPRHLRAHLDTVVARIEAKLNGEDAEEGAKTGFPHLDRLTGGLLPETFTVIAARPGMGKTAFAMNLEQAVARSGRPTLFFSLEMTGSAIAQRHIAKCGRIPLGNLKSAMLADNEWSGFTDAVHELSGLPFYIDDSPGLALPEIRSRSRAFINEHPEGLILVDYLQIVAQGKKSGFQDTKTHVSEVSRGFKAMARELRCPVVALAQLNRDLEKRANKRPMMSDLRESGQLEQDAEVIIFLYRDEYYNPDSPEKGVAEIIVGKNRDGETGTVKASFEGRVMNFVELGEVIPNE